MAELRVLLVRAEEEGTAQQFAQASADLLRGPDSDPAELSAWVDFGTRPARYCGLLAEITGRGLSPADRSRAYGAVTHDDAYPGAVESRSHRPVG